MIIGTAHLTLRHAQPVYTLCLKNGGACSLSFIDGFNAALDEIEAAQGPACLIITGQDKSFSTGFHLDDFFSGDAALRNDMLNRSTRLLSRVAALPLPTAAAINGHAFGFGALLALACDRRIMRSDRGFFCLPELDLQVAIPRPMMELLKLKLRHEVLSDLLFSGRRIGGQEAFGLGIVDAACPLAELMARAQAIVQPLAEKNRATLGAMKRELYRQFLDTVPLD
jgi:Delta3-Delta2-enoyl-CoA isomerase